MRCPLTLHLRVKRLNIRLRVSVRAWNNLSNNHSSLRPLGHHIVDQTAQSGVSSLPAVSSTVVGAGVQQDDVGSDACAGNAVGRAGDLVDHPARVALVVLVGHRARLHRSDVVDFGAGRGQRGEEELAVAVAGGASDAILSQVRRRAVLFEWLDFAIYLR